MRNQFKKYASLALAGALALSLAACGGGSSSSGGSGDTASTPAAASGDASDFTPLTLRMGNQHNSESVGNKLDQELCDRIAEVTEGRVTVELYSDSALGDYTNMFDELMVGSLDMAHISPVESYDSRVSGTMLPYLAFDYETLLQVYAEGSFLYTEISDALNNLGIRLGGIFCEGFNGIGVMQELEGANTAGVEKGCIIRSPMLDVYSLEMQDLGFRVSSLPYSDTYTSMQTGVVAGLAGCTAQMNYLAFRDLITHFYDYRYNQEATMILISNQTWEKLLPEDQEAISAVIKEICEKAAVEAETINDEYMETMAAEGINVVTFTDEELAAFYDSCHANVWPQLAANYPEGWLESLEAEMAA